MNGRQLTFVLAGLAIFIAGAFLGLRPVRRTSDGTVLISPLIDPVGAMTASPGAVLTAVLVPALGLAVALVGCYVTRGRR